MCAPTQAIRRKARILYGIINAFVCPALAVHTREFFGNQMEMEKQSVGRGGWLDLFGSSSYSHYLGLPQHEQLRSSTSN